MWNSRPLNVPQKVPAPSFIFDQLKIGAGGFLMETMFAPDGTMVSRNDTYGAYKWNASTLRWDLLNVVPAFPVNQCGKAANGDAITDGVYGYGIAPSNSLRQYMFWVTKLFRTDDGGRSWILLSNFTGGAGCIGNDHGAGDPASASPKIAVDPINPDHVLVGGGPNGLFRSTDGGLTWGQVTDVLAPSGNAITIVAFDPSSAQSGGKTQGVYAGSDGRGIYHSTNAGLNFTLTTGTHTTVKQMAIASDGTVFHVPNEGNYNLYVWNGTSWTTRTVAVNGASIQSVACDPFTLNNIAAVSNNGSISYSIDKGVTWSGFSQTFGMLTRQQGLAGDPPWLLTTNEITLSSAHLIFDPLVQNRVWLAEGIGQWYCDPRQSSISTLTFSNGSSVINGVNNYQADQVVQLQTTIGMPGNFLSFTNYFVLAAGLSTSQFQLSTTKGGTPIVASSAGSGTITTIPGTIWSSYSKGIEQLVANGAISPPGGKPLVLAWDRPGFYVDDPQAYPANQAPNNNVAITVGTSIDWASSDPTFIALLANYLGTNNAKSTDGGKTWVTLNAPGTVNTNNPGGGLAAASPSVLVWIPKGLATVYFTSNGGTSWGTATISGPINPYQESGASVNRQIVAADRVNIGTFYLYYNGTSNSDGAGTNADGAIAGIYKSTDGGANWAKVFAGRLANTGSANLDYSVGFYAARLKSVPRIAAQNTAGHLFWTAGDVGGSVVGALRASFDGFATTPIVVANVLEVSDIGFGAPLPGSDYPTVFIVGWVGGTALTNYGVWMSTSNLSAWLANAQTWTKITSFPYGNGDFVKCLSGDSNVYGRVYGGFQGSGWFYGRLN